MGDRVAYAESLPVLYETDPNHTGYLRPKGTPGAGVVDHLTAGNGITLDATDPTAPIVTVTPVTTVADLTDSTGGTPASSLVAVRSDTAAHTAADANANFASLNAKLKAVTDALKAGHLMS